MPAELDCPRCGEALQLGESDCPYCAGRKKVPLYRRDPVVHTVELTLLVADGFPDDSFLMTVWEWTSM